MKIKFKLRYLSISVSIIFSILLIIKINGSLLSDKNYSENNVIKKFTKVELALFNAEREFKMTRDPITNQIPPNIRERELSFAKTLPKKEDYRYMKGNKPEIQVYDWVARGPNNVSGRIKCLGIDIENENIIIAGAASGGIWRSMDVGKTWTKVSSPDDEQRIYCIKQDTRFGKANTWYAGTGELLSTTDRKYGKKWRTVGIGNGIYKSTDNGASWFPLKSTLINAPDSLKGVFQGIWDIAIEHTNNEQDVVYAAGYGAIMRSTDGGNSWSKTIGDLNNKCFSTDIAITRNGTLYAALGGFTTDDSKPEISGIFRSEDGLNWENITPAGFPSQFFNDPIRVIKLAIAPSNEDVLYVFCETPYSKYYAHTFAFKDSFHSFWKYTHNEQTDKGTWEERSANLPGGWNTMSGNTFNSLGGYCFALNVHPQNEDIVYIGGTSLYRNTTGFKDSVATKQIGGYPYRPDLPEQLHPDMHDITFLKSNPNTMLVSNDGGIHITNDNIAGKVTWSQKFFGLNSTQFYAITIDKKLSGDDFIFGGLQDNSCFSTNTSNPNTKWRVHVGGDGMDCDISNDRSFVVASVYTGSIFTVLFDKNMDEDSTLSQTPNQLTTDKFDFYTRFALDPNNSDILYLPAKNKLWKKFNLIASSRNRSLRDQGWQEIKQVQIPSNISISAIAASTKPGGIIYLGTDNGMLYRLEDSIPAQPKFVDIASPDLPQGGYISCIEIDPYDANRLFVVFSNYNIQSIFYTTNGGSTWDAQGGNLEDQPDGTGAGPSVRWFKMLNRGDKYIYFAGTSIGLFSTDELSGSQTQWIQEGSTAFGNVIIDHIVARESDGLVAIATQGYGVWTTNVPVSSEAAEQKSNYFFLEQNYPNPACEQTQITFTLQKSGNVKLNIYDVSGTKLMQPLKNYMHSGKHSIKINTSTMQNGSYFYRLETSEGVLTRKMVVKR